MMGDRQTKPYVDDAEQGGNGAYSNDHYQSGMPGEGIGIKKETAMRKYLPFVTFLVALVGLVLGIAALAIAVDNKNDIDQVKDMTGEVQLSSRIDPSARGYRNMGQLWAGTGNWGAKTPLPEARSDFAITKDGNDIYLVGGLDENGTILSSVLKYNPFLHLYEEVAPLPETRFRHGAAVLDQELYVIGGYTSDEASSSGQPSECLRIYNIENNEWREGACTEFPHGDTCAATLGGKLYVIGGYGESYATLRAVEEYDPATGSWSRVPDLPEGRGDVMCAVSGGELYALGGYDGDTFTSSVYSYNPTTRTWRTRAEMPYVKGDGAATALPGNKILVVSGETTVTPGVNKASLHWTEEYYPELDMWVDKAPITNPRFRTGAAEVGGIVYVFGGHQVCDTDDPSADGRLCSDQAIDSVEAFLDIERYEPLSIYVKE